MVRRYFPRGRADPAAPRRTIRRSCANACLFVVVGLAVPAASAESASGRLSRALDRLRPASGESLARRERRTERVVFAGAHARQHVLAPGRGARERRARARDAGRRVLLARLRRLVLDRRRRGRGSAAGRSSRNVAASQRKGAKLRRRASSSDARRALRAMRRDAHPRRHRVRRLAGGRATAAGVSRHVAPVDGRYEGRLVRVLRVAAVGARPEPDGRSSGSRFGDGAARRRPRPRAAGGVRRALGRRAGRREPRARRQAGPLARAARRRRPHRRVSRVFSGRPWIIPTDPGLF